LTRTGGKVREQRSRQNNRGDGEVGFYREVITAPIEASGNSRKGGREFDELAGFFGQRQTVILGRDRVKYDSKGQWKKQNLRGGKNLKTARDWRGNHGEKKRILKIC